MNASEFLFYDLKNQICRMLLIFTPHGAESCFEDIQRVFDLRHIAYDLNQQLLVFPNLRIENPSDVSVGLTILPRLQGTLSVCHKLNPIDPSSSQAEEFLTHPDPALHIPIRCM
jgi:hypothetical protein